MSSKIYTTNKEKKEKKNKERRRKRIRDKLSVRRWLPIID
uniref:Uncharacterized protein n=1 Tax=Nelumbo nucifera TaxID=4432 RepID=A0A822Z6N6_NELNU|nr:TPA_asm: hypothetical protein HUJ06_013448 [Nelumbo nucifera]